MSDALGSSQALLQHYLRSLVYRFNHVTGGAPAEFGEFEAGADVRSPIRIVRHMTGLLGFVLSQLNGADNERLDPLDWAGELDRFAEFAAQLDERLQSGGDVKGSLTFGQLWRGPLTDAMTHVGQLATLRRLAGLPIGRERYWQVDMPPLKRE